MVLIDFSHMSMRNLYVALSQARPRKVEGEYITSEFITFYYHLMLQSLRHISDKFDNYGEIVLALDSKDNWRKDIYPEYKGHRKKDRDKSEVNFSEFFEYVESFTDVLNANFPYKVIRVHRAEADDIIGILAERYADYEKVIAVSSDKDFKQILEVGAELYDPIKKAKIRMSTEELKKWKIVHILCGDSADNIPHVKRGTEFTPTFISYLKENEIHVKDPATFNKLTISEKLYSDFNVYKVNKKGEVLDELDIFKATPFGPKTAEKFADDLKSNLKLNPIYASNFRRNMDLVLFSKIPQDIQDTIINDFKGIEVQYDPNGIFKFLSENHLSQQLMNVTDFYIDSKKSQDRTSSPAEAMDEWI